MLVLVLISCTKKSEGLKANENVVVPPFTVFVNLAGASAAVAGL
jgi:hypothetical protein